MYHYRKAFIYIAIVVIGILYFIKVSAENSLSQLTQSYVDLTTQTSSLKLQNELLREQILKESSLTTIEMKARAAGFEEAKTVVIK